MEKLKNKWLLASALFLTGCGLYDTVDVAPNPQPTVTVVVDTSLASKIKASLKNASREDCIKLYKFCSGLSSYLKSINDDDMQTDKIFNKTLDDVQKQYSWDRAKYPEYTDVIEADLKARNLAEPHKLGDINTDGKKYKDVITEAFDNYSEILKDIIQGK